MTSPSSAEKTSNLLRNTSNMPSVLHFNMKKLFITLTSLFFIGALHTHEAHAQRTPLFLERKIELLENTYETKCDGENSSRRVCQIIQFRINNVNDQITTFLLREQERKSKVKHELNSLQFKTQVIDLTNFERRKMGLKDLRYNAKLEKAAQDHTDDMNTHDYFSHTGLSGSKPVDRIRNAGYLASFEACNCTKSYTVGENIALGQTTPEQVIEDWMESPDHRKNILNEDYDEIGIGISGNYWAQNFGNISLVK